MRYGERVLIEESEEERAVTWCGGVYSFLKTKLLRSITAMETIKSYNLPQLSSIVITFVEAQPV